ncbi:MAG: spore coat polysaccharide biosynthesis protein SpsF [Chlamydiales bacterium]|jgi:spore coat polysaccharide biosynthesis protein SpsF
MNEANRSYRNNVVAGIQARMGSTRLPGKSLAELAGIPMIQRVYERASAASCVDAVIVLTTTEAVDDPLAEHCERNGIPCRRGPEQDVFARYTQLMDEFGPRYVVRITGDCPFICPQHIDAQVRALEAHDADFAPAGATEHVFAGQAVISSHALQAAARSTDPADREHVGSFYLAQHANDFCSVPIRTTNFPGSDHLRLCVDEATDLEAARAVYDALAPTWGSLIPITEVVRYLLANEDVGQLASAAGHSDANRRLQAIKGQTRASQGGSSGAMG